MDEHDSLSFLFNFNTEHWVTVNIQEKEHRLKYIPLSIKEKINIGNKYLFLEEGDIRTSKIINDQCILMLKKGYPDGSINPESFTSSILVEIYTKIIQDMVNRKKDIESFYEQNKTALIDTSKMKNKPNKLNTLISTCSILTKCNLDLNSLSDLDEISLFCLMIFSSEESIREMNYYSEMNEKKR